MRKVSAAATVVVVLILWWFARSARREASYRTALAHYQSELPLGTPRAEVQKYLDSQGVKYMGDVEWVAWQPDGLHSIAITLGPTSGSLGCTSTAYLELDFELSGHSADRAATPSDRLKKIEIGKISRDCV